MAHFQLLLELLLDSPSYSNQRLKEWRKKISVKKIPKNGLICDQKSCVGENKLLQNDDDGDYD